MTPPAVDTNRNHGVVLRPFRALRPSADGDDLARLLCPPYDVIDPALRSALLATEPNNAVGVVLPEAPDGEDRYQSAADRLSSWVDSGRFVVDDAAALYVYEMRGDDGSVTRGLVGAVELRDPDDGVILPHENTMAGPVADRLALMTATEANVEPIYLVYDGGGPASTAVAEVDQLPHVAQARTTDGITHTLWALTEPVVLDEIATDLADRRALIADGHHRYATYRQLQTALRAQRGSGPWDFGLTLLVDSSSYGPQVHAIHRVLVGVELTHAVEAAAGHGLSISEASSPADGLAVLEGSTVFGVVLSDGHRTMVISDPDGELRAASRRADEPAVLSDLDVTALHRGLIEHVWQLEDNVDTVGYAHSVDEAVSSAEKSGGTAVLLRATPVAAVAAVAAAGARMPRKSTLFTPKPASGLIMRRFADDG